MIVPDTIFKTYARLSVFFVTTELFQKRTMHRRTHTFTRKGQIKDTEELKSPNISPGPTVKCAAVAAAVKREREIKLV